MNTAHQQFTLAVLCAIAAAVHAENVPSWIWSGTALVWLALAVRSAVRAKYNLDSPPGKW